ncbi:hypothetical protein CPB97_009074 [Podila verticillata]|nr:hypothetical protein CPB97_009074 [Podila verticillata]
MRLDFKITSLALVLATMTTMTTMTLAAPLKDIQKITDGNFQTVINDSKYVLVEFLQNNCDFCNDVERRLRDIAPAYKASLTVVSLNSNENLEQPSQYTVNEFPALVLFRSGAYVAALTGNKDRDEIETFLENNGVKA